jgi:hypothetical protein
LRYFIYRSENRTMEHVEIVELRGKVDREKNRGCESNVRWIREKNRGCESN